MARTSLLNGVLCAGFAIACARPTPEETRISQGPEPPSLAEIAAAEIVGVMDEDVSLVDGRWHGEPYDPDGSSRPSVWLLDRLATQVELDAYGSIGTVVLLGTSAGGSGTRTHVAVMARVEGRIQSVATALLGDRVQVRSLSSAGRQILLEVVRQGPGDPACCPTQTAISTWTLSESGLEEQETEVTGVLSLGHVHGTGWVLTHFARNDAAPEDPEVTLLIEEDRVEGTSGCNRYTISVTESSPGSIKLGPIAGTRMMCPENEMAVENRYHRFLSGVERYGFLTGDLVLTYQEGDTSGFLRFREVDGTMPGDGR